MNNLREEPIAELKLKVFIVDFYLKEMAKDKSDKYLGYVKVYDFGLKDVIAKAFCQASPTCQAADKVIIYEVKS